MSQYLLSVHMVEGQTPYADEAEMNAAFANVDAFNTELQSSGAWVFAGGLQPADVATVVDASGSETVTTDGPFSEAKEHIGGFWVIDVADLDAALDWAAKGSAACLGPVEVRPFQGNPRTDHDTDSASSGPPRDPTGETRSDPDARGSVIAVR